MTKDDLLVWHERVLVVWWRTWKDSCFADITEEGELDKDICSQFQQEREQLLWTHLPHAICGQCLHKACKVPKVCLVRA